MNEPLNKFKSTLLEYWNSFLDLLPDIVVSIFIVALFTLAAIFIARLIRHRMEKRGSENRIVITFTARIIRLVLIIIGVVIALHLLGFRGAAGGLLAGAGVGAIILGFAFKEIGENFLAGIILVFDRPFSIGDTVTVQDKMGVVIELNFRNTHLKSFDGQDIYVPNASIIKSNLSNHTRDGLLRLDFIIGIDYNNDISDARKYIMQALLKIDGVLQSQPPLVIVESLSTSSVDLRVLFWVDTLDYKNSSLMLKSTVMETVKELLMDKGFGLPASIQELKIYDSSEPIPVKVEK